MGLVKGGFQRLFQTFLYFLCFLCAGLILGVYSYFLAVLSNRNEFIADWKKAVEGLSGAAVIYTICATILTCCLGGISFFAFLAIVLDLCFCGSMIAIAVMTRSGASSCTGIVNTPIGYGPANEDNGYGAGGFGSGRGENLTYAVHLGAACRLNTAAFAVSIIAAFLFLCTAAMQVALVRHHKKEKRFGPGPDNNYTSGYGKKKGLFARNKKTNNTRDAEMAGGLAPAAVDTRPSHETGYTGSTMAAPNGVDNHDKVNGVNGTHGGYYTQPQGSGVNPYGYNNTNTAANY